VVAAVPVTCAKDIEVVGFEGCSTRYESRRHRQAERGRGGRRDDHGAARAVDDLRLLARPRFLTVIVPVEPA